LWPLFGNTHPSNLHGFRKKKKKIRQAFRFNKNFQKPGLLERSETTSSLFPLWLFPRDLVTSCPGLLASSGFPNLKTGASPPSVHLEVKMFRTSLLLSETVKVPLSTAVVPKF
jgi:hypothetical protein